MMQRIFDNIIKYGLADWGVVLQGILGIPGHVERLPPVCIEKFATTALQEISMSDPLIAAISGLAMDSNLPTADIYTLLEEICACKKTDMQRAKRIWRVVALKDVLENLDSDPVYGLMAISEFWSAWAWPSDAPSSMLVSIKILLPEHEYYSASNYDRVVHEHDEWVRTEFASLGVGFQNNV